MVVLFGFLCFAFFFLSIFFLMNCCCYGDLLFGREVGVGVWSLFMGKNISCSWLRLKLDDMLAGFMREL